MFGCIVVYINPETNVDLNISTVGQVLNSGTDGKVMVFIVTIK